MQHPFQPMAQPKAVSQERLNEIMARRGGKVDGRLSMPSGAESPLVVAQHVNRVAGSIEGGSTESPTLGEGAVTTAVKLGTVTPATIQSPRGGVSEVGAPSAAVEHPVSAATLEWLRPQGEGMRSKCGRFSIARYANAEGERRYEVWRVIPGTASFKRIAGDLASSDIAKRFAQDQVIGGHREGA